MISEAVRKPEDTEFRATGREREKVRSTNLVRSRSVT